MSTASETVRDNTATTGGPASLAWKTWPDWVNVVLGVYLLWAPIWTAAAPVGWFVTLGILIALVGVWALGTVSSAPSEWIQIVLGVITFLAPWIGGFATAAGAAWTAWIIGIGVIVFAAIGMAQARRTAPATQTI